MHTRKLCKGARQHMIKNMLMVREGHSTNPCDGNETREWLPVPVPQHSGTCLALLPVAIGISVCSPTGGYVIRWPSPTIALPFSVGQRSRLLWKELPDDPVDY